MPMNTIFNNDLTGKISNEEKEREEYEIEQEEKSLEYRKLSLAEQIETQINEGKSVSDKDILNACIGNNKGQPKCTTMTILNEYHGDLNKYNNEKIFEENSYSSIATRIIKNPIFDIKLKDEFLQIDAIFKTATDPELKILTSQLNMYEDILDSYLKKESDKYPLFTINIMPNQYIGQHYLSICNPHFWILQPETPGMAMNNILRIIVKADNVIVFNDINENLNIKQLDAEVKRNSIN